MPGTLHSQVQHSHIPHGDFIPSAFSEQMATFVLYSINGFVFITEVESVYSAVRTEFLYNTDKFRIYRYSAVHFSTLQVYE